MRIILLLLLLPTLLSSQDSQLVWLSRPISGGETLLIDYDGKVRCKLPADDRLLMRKRSSFVREAKTTMSMMTNSPNQKLAYWVKYV